MRKYRGRQGAFLWGRGVGTIQGETSSRANKQVISEERGIRDGRKPLDVFS